MMRVNRATRVAARPARPAGEYIGGYFTGGDPLAGVPATVPGHEWFNTVQEELAGLIEAWLGTLDPDSSGQLAAAIDARIAARRLQVGDLYPGLIVPDNCLELDGATLLRADYPELWAWAGTHSLVVSQASWTAGRYGLFGDGDGVTTFALPKLADEFLRIYNPAGSRLQGAWQADALKAHSHSIRGYGMAANAGGNGFIAPNGGTGAIWNANYISTEGDTETRPRNVNSVRLSICYA